MVGPRLVRSSRGLGEYIKKSEPALGGGGGGGWRALEIQAGSGTLNPRAEGARSRRRGER